MQGQVSAQKLGVRTGPPPPPPWDAAPLGHGPPWAARQQAAPRCRFVPVDAARLRLTTPRHRPIETTPNRFPRLISIVLKN